MVYDSTPKSGHTIYVSYTKNTTTVPRSHLLCFVFFKCNRQETYTVKILNVQTVPYILVRK